MRPDPVRTLVTESTRPDGRFRPSRPILVGLLIGVLSLPAFGQGQMRQSDGPRSDTSSAALTDEPADAGESNPGAASEQSGESDAATTQTAQADAAEDAASSDDAEATDAGDDTPETTTGDDAERVAASASVRPDIVKAQQQRYQALRETWRRRILPDVLASDVGGFTLRDSGVRAVALQANNVEFYLDDGIGYQVNQLRALLEPKNAGEPVDFDDPEQFDIHIISGEVLIRPQDLDALFNRYVLDYQPRALSSVSNKTSEDTLTVEVGARLFEFIPPVGGLPTTLSGPIEVTDDNKLVYTPDSVKQFGIPVKPLLDGIGLELQTLTPFNREGVKLESNRLVMDPETMFPPPRIRIDKLTGAKLTDAGLTLTFGSDQSDAGFTDPPVSTDSYIWLQAGDARFYSTLLVNANLQLMNSAEERLRFNLYHYRAQSAAGTISTLESGALVVRVPNDFEIDDNDVHQYSGLTPRFASGGDPMTLKEESGN